MRLPNLGLAASGWCGDLAALELENLGNIGMFQFIVVNVLMLSLGTALYLIARALPRVEEAGGVKKSGIVERWVNSQVPEKIDVVLNGFLVKILRRLKVLLLKVDNSISRHMKKVNPASNGNGKAGLGLKDLAGEKRAVDASKEKEVT